MHRLGGVARPNFWAADDFQIFTFGLRALESRVQAKI
jgi:hypothetical protein